VSDEPNIATLDLCHDARCILLCSFSCQRAGAAYVLQGRSDEVQNHPLGGIPAMLNELGTTLMSMLVVVVFLWGGHNLHRRPRRMNIGL
jgi:hypothetical protein